MANGRKILIVEDNRQNMRLIKMALSKLGCELLEATDGEQALEQAYREKPDLILMDIQIPGLDGLEVTRRLRQSAEFNRVLILALTAHAMKGDREKIISAGCNAYLAKPFDTRELPGLIEQALKNALAAGRSGEVSNGEKDTCR